MKLNPKAVHIQNGYYAVEEAYWIPVSPNGFVIDADGFASKGVYNDFYRYYIVDTIIEDRCWPVFVHRAVALTFLECPGDPSDYQVNHIDGNKENNVVENLEWVTASENALHAYKTGLRSDNRIVYSKDLETGKVREYYSLQECARKFGVNGSLIRFYLRGKRKIPWRKRWTFIYKGEEWPNLSKADVGKTKGVTREVIAMPVEDGLVPVIFPSQAEAAKHSKINRATLGWYLNRLGIDQSNVYGGYAWHYLDDYRGSVQNAERRGKERKYGKNLNKRKPKRVMVTDLTTGDTQIWESLWILSEHLGVKKNTMEKRILLGNGIYDNCKYEYLQHQSLVPEMVR